MENILYSGKIPAEITNNSLYSNVCIRFYRFEQESFFQNGSVAAGFYEFPGYAHFR
jgi:hypothetical protein